MPQQPAPDRRATHALRFRWIDGLYAVCRLAPDDPTPPFCGDSGAFHATIRTADELTLVIPDDQVPAGIPSERGWVAGRICGTLDFALVGILAQLTTTLARADISVFAISTFDTDYLLVRSPDQQAASAALEAAGLM